MGKRKSRRAYGFTAGRKRSLPQAQQWPEQGEEGTKREAVKFEEVTRDEE